MLIRAVFLDAVGTLLHPEPPADAVYADAGRAFGSRLDRAAIAARFRAAFRRQEDLDHAAGLRTDEAREEARWRAIVAEVLDDVGDADACFRRLFAAFARPEAWRVDAEAAAVLAELQRRGLQLGLASNFDRRLRGLAEALPALQPLRCVVISSEVGWRKPAAAFYAELPRRTGLKPAEILVVGDDRINDYEGARAAGMAALLLDPRRRADLPDDQRLLRLADLPARLPETP
jgi:putative hydrolase of the HAD superfamily